MFKSIFSTKFKSLFSFKFLVLVLLLLGILFRTANLDARGYWFDECFTSLRISGYTFAEYKQTILEKREFGVDTLLKFQQPSDRDFNSTVVGLATEEPQLTPLYFIAARFWVQLFGTQGDIVAVTRSLSAVISLFVLCAIYWLTKELFGSSLTALIAVGLIAVSPMQIGHAQISRYYTAYSLSFILSTIFLWRSCKSGKWKDWFIYAASLTMGLYIFPFNAFVILGHSLYFVLTNGIRLHKRLAQFATAIGLTILGFMPWLLIIISNLSVVRQTTSWVNNKLGIATFLSNLLDSLKILFLNFNFRSLNTGFSVAILLLIIYAFYSLIRNAPRQVWLVIICLGGATAIPLVFYDVISGGGTLSLTDRYMLPFYISVYLAMAYLFSIKIWEIPSGSTVMESKLHHISKLFKPLLNYFLNLLNHLKIWNLKNINPWKYILIAIISLGVLSGVTELSNPAPSSANAPILPIINRSTKPLIIHAVMPVKNSWRDYISARLLSLSHGVKTNTRFLVVNASDLDSLSIPSGFSDVFLFQVENDEVLTSLSKRYGIQNLVSEKRLYLISPLVP